MKIVIVYGADWCGPCKMLKSAFSREDIEYTYIDIDAKLKETREAEIRGVPTILIVEEDKQQIRIIGFNDSVLERIKQEIKE